MGPVHELLALSKQRLFELTNIQCDEWKEYIEIKKRMPKEYKNVEAWVNY